MDGRAVCQWKWAGLSSRARAFCLASFALLWRLPDGFLSGENTSKHNLRVAPCCFPEDSGSLFVAGCHTIMLCSVLGVHLCEQHRKLCSCVRGHVACRGAWVHIDVQKCYSSNKCAEFKHILQGGVGFLVKYMYSPMFFAAGKSGAMQQCLPSGIGRNLICERGHSVGMTV